MSTTALLETSAGTMELRFWDDLTPATVENFLQLARDQFYDGTAFHRIVEGFMIQGGDPLTKDPAQKARWGTGGPGHTLKAEFHDRPHRKGVISMARTADPDSAGSQFFLCLDDCPFLDGQYTAFGELVAGEEVLESLGRTECGWSASGEKSAPKERVDLHRVVVRENG